MPLFYLRVFALLACCAPLVAAFGEFENGPFQKLVGCVLEEKPYIYKDSTQPSGYNGVGIQYLKRLQENLGFSIELQPWSRSFSDFIDTMWQCDYENEECPCDIGVGSFTMTNARAEKIRFVAPFSNEAHHMVSRKSDLRVDDSKNTWFVFKTFSPEVWIIIFVGIFMHAIGTMFFGPFRPPPKSGLPLGQCARVMWQIKRFPAAILFSYAHLIGHPFGERAQGTPSFHRSAWLVLGVTTGLFLLTVYEASLTVLLFESTQSSPFRNLDDVRNCAINPNRVAMIQGGASQAFWNDAVNITQIRADCDVGGNWGVTVENLEQGFAAVKSGSADYFYTLEGSIMVRANRNCADFALVGEPFFSTAVAFVLPNKTDPELERQLSRTTRILREQDGFKTARSIAESTSCEDVVDAKITSGKLWAFFVLYAVSWVVLLTYRCVFLWRRRKKSLKDDSSGNSSGIVMMNMNDMPSRDITGVSGRQEDSLEHFNVLPQYHIRPSQFQISQETYQRQQFVDP